MLVFLLMLQYAVQAHARRVAQAAAAQALAAAEAYNGSPAAGQAAGEDLLAHLGGSLEGAEIAVSRGTDTAAVDVTGDARQLIPFLPARISVHVEGPIEHYVATP